MEVSSHKISEADGRQVGCKIHQVLHKGHHSNDPGADKMVNDPKKDSVTESAEDKLCSSDARPKEGISLSIILSFVILVPPHFVKLVLIYLLLH